MMWNQNDTKYIIKRLILYLIISGIVFFSATQCSKANTYSASFTYNQLNLLSNNYDGTTFNGGLAFVGTGQGDLVFSAVVKDGGQVLKQAYLNVGTSANDLVQLQCDIGNTSGYSDSQVNLYVYTIKCTANLGSGVGIYSVGFQGIQNKGGLLVLSDRATYITSPDSSSAIISAQQSSAQNTINEIISQGQYDRVNADANATRIINEINTATSSQTTAINNNTQAVNDLNDNIMTDFDFDSSSITAITDIISTGDKNKIRDFLMFPIRLLMIVMAHIGNYYCYNFNLGSLLGTNLVLPCIDIQSIIGTNLYNTIDVIFATCVYIGIVIYIRKLLDYLFSLGATSFDNVNVEVFN